jgi:ATP-dependent Lhr-like helicase
VFATADEAGHRRPSEREMLDALWDLVWAGEVTNDTFGPLRALRWPRRGSGRGRVGAGYSRARPGTRMGPPEAAGRWSLVADAMRTAAALAGGSDATETERRAALAASLLERYGVVTRDTVAAEGVPGGFGAVYPILREMEERGRVRRGYFVGGLGGAQFAVAGAVDRLRSLRRAAGAEHGPEATTVLLAASDPANPYGAALAWPPTSAGQGHGPTRSAGAYVVIHDGEPILYLERGGRSLVTFLPFYDAEIGRLAMAGLAGLVHDGRLRRLQLERVDGAPVAESSWRERLSELGFRAAYKGYVLEAAR